MGAMNKILLATSALVALAAAVPFDRRSIYTEMVTETAWTTVDVAATIWVDEKGNVIRTEQGGIFAQSTATAAPAVPTSVSAAPAFTPSAAPSYPASSAAAQSWSPPAMAASSQFAAAPAPSATASQAPPPAASSAAAAPPPPQSSSPVVPKQSSDIHTGDVTHWDGGLGACGWDVVSDKDLQIALPVGLMGAQSNDNPYCGKSVTIKNPTTGATQPAIVGDKCMGCTGDSIDLTNALFTIIASGCDGRCSNFEWWFN